MPFSRCLVKLYTLIAVIWRTFLKQIHSRCTCIVWSRDVQRITSAYHHDLWVVPMNGWWMKYWQLARWYFMRWHQPLHFNYSWWEPLWAGPSDEHGKVGSPWSCDAHHTIMILEERTLKEVLVYIQAVYMQLLLKGVSAIIFANVALCGLGILTHCALWHSMVHCPDVLVRIWRSQWWSLLHSCCMFFCDKHQTTKIREAFFDKWWLAWWKPSTCVFVMEPVLFCVLKTATFGHGTVPWWKQTTPPGFLEDICTRVWLTWCCLDCEEVPARIIAIFAQCGLVINTIGLHTCKTFPPNTWWHFVQLSCVCSWAVVRLVVALCGLVENIIPPWCVRGALSEAWNHMMVVLPFRCLRRGPSHDQRFFCIEWLCGTHESYWLLQEVCT